MYFSQKFQNLDTQLARPLWNRKRINKNIITAITETRNINKTIQKSLSNFRQSKL